MVGRFWRAAVGGALAGALVVGPAPSSPAAEMRVVDGGVVDGSPARRAAAGSAARMASPQELISLSQKVEIGGEEYFYSGPLGFDWTIDTVSVVAYMEP